ncbi:MAG: glycosyltransferase involved in cell wall biosynthesis [Chlamydiales bacterium]|jgi:glycosyltransferase involved in cell wall biosynthesis
MKISVVAPDLSGGGMTRAYWIARVLTRAEHEVQIVGRSIRGDVYPGPPDGISVVQVELDDSDASMRALFERVEGDLIYAIKPLKSSFGVALLAKKHRDRPVLLDIDDWEHGPLDGFDASLGEIARRVVRHPLESLARLRGRRRLSLDENRRMHGRRLEQMTDQADAITADTRFLASRYGGTYLPNGKDTDLFDPSRFDPEVSRRRLGLSSFRVLMFPGTPQPHKGLEDLLLAMDELQWPDLRLVLVGGRENATIDRLIAGWDRWIVRLPRYSADEMPEIISAAHVVVVPQRDTAQARAQCPMKLTDGMAMAKPILSTHVGDIPDILDGTGFVVRPSSPTELAAGIRQVFSGPSAARILGARARVRCIRHYGLTPASEVLKHLISRLPRCQQRHSGP